ncbi:unnamed protein product, partial [Allacma fusca]
PTTTHTEIAVSNATSQNLEMITDLPGSHQDCWILLITFNWCATVGSRDYKHHARWLLCRIFVQSVSVNINWTGILKKRAPKRAFKGMNIYNVVIPAIAKRHSVKEDIVETCRGKWFRGAVDRDGGRSKRY